MLIPLIIVTALGFCITALALNTTTKALTNSSNHEASLINVNDTGRRGKQLQIDRIVLPFSGREVKRHVIKIPPNVSKVKLIGTAPPPQGPPKKIHQMKKFPFSDVPLSQKLSSTNSQAFEEYDYEEDESLSPSNVKRTFVSNGANDEFEDEFPGSESIELDHYYTNAQPIKQKKNRTSKRPIKHIRKVSKQVKDDSFFPTYARPERFTQKHENFYGAFKNRYKTGIPDSQDYNYEPHETTVYFKKVQPSNGYGMKPFPPNILNQHQEKPILGNYYEANHMISPSNVKKRVSKPRKPLLNPQYTTHNPHVATNFGLSAYSTSNNHDYLSNGHFVGSTLGYGMTIPAPTESVISAVPVLPSKIKVIQPPQLGDAALNRPLSPSRHLTSTPSNQGQTVNQKATIRDILNQDCPGHDIIGFCGSPPRYPMHQINDIVKRCAKLMEVMSTQNLIDQQDVGEFSSRLDSKVLNKTIALDFGFNQKRSSSDGIQVCNSEFNLIQPGYAREVTTGRWFVVVQHPEVAQQSITIDSCKSPGMPCGGLVELKCSTVNNNLMNKSSKCIQRFAYHRLISWDPDVPDLCPRMRIFKFPSACVCHIGVA